jgi:hypothetical protein
MLFDTNTHTQTPYPLWKIPTTTGEDEILKK